MTNEQLIRQYYDGDEAALEKLYHKNIGLFCGIAKEAAAAFGLDRDHAGREAPPRSTLYSTAISPSTLTIAGEEKALQPGSADSLQASLTLNARLAGIDAEKLGKRLETSNRDAHPGPHEVRENGHGE